MFNRKSAAIDDQPGPSFEPDFTGQFVAALDVYVPDQRRYSGSRPVMHRLIGRETLTDGSERLIVLPYEGVPRPLDPDEPHRLLTAAEAREFDYLGWRDDERQSLRDRRRSRELTARRQAMRAQLEAALVVYLGANSVRQPDGSTFRPNEDSHDTASELIAAGEARTVGDWLVTNRPASVDLSRWRYLDTEGRALFTPISGGRRLLVHRTPARNGSQIPTDRYPVCGDVTREGDTWTAYLAPAGVELVGPGVRGTWEFDTGADASAWFDARRDEDTAEREAAAVAAVRDKVRARLLSDYGVTPRTDAERTVCEELRREGEAYEVEGTYVLARAT